MLPVARGQKQSEASRCYDHHIALEAARKGTNPNRLPKKRFVARSCGKHFAVEPEGAPRGRPCEQCVAARIGRGKGGGYKPSYLWEGANYLLKMLHDLDFLGDVDTLTEFLAPPPPPAPPAPASPWPMYPLLLAPEVEASGQGPS